MMPRLAPDWHEDCNERRYTRSLLRVKSGLEQKRLGSVPSAARRRSGQAVAAPGTAVNAAKPAPAVPLSPPAFPTRKVSLSGVGNRVRLVPRLRQAHLPHRLYLLFLHPRLDPTRVFLFARLPPNSPKLVSDRQRRPWEALTEMNNRQRFSSLSRS